MRKNHKKYEGKIVNCDADRAKLIVGEGSILGTKNQVLKELSCVVNNAIQDLEYAKEFWTSIIEEKDKNLKEKNIKDIKYEIYCGSTSDYYGEEWYAGIRFSASKPMTEKEIEREAKRKKLKKKKKKPS